MNLFEIARSVNDSKSFYNLSILIDSSKFLEIIKKHDLLNIVSEYVDSVYSNLDDRLDTNTVYRSNNNYIDLVWQTIDSTDDIKYVNSIQIGYMYIDRNKALELIDDIKNEIVSNDNSDTFYVMNYQNGEMFLIKEKIDKTHNNIELNYGKEFVKISNNIIKGLSSERSGIVILSGNEGTGKTEYVKHVIYKISNQKNVIFIPRHLLILMAETEFISFIKDQVDSVLILEDADDILSNRDEILSSTIINNILSLTNGLINDSLKIKIFITFTIDRKYIDKKLLKSHRIIEDYHFKLLLPDQANLLASNLNIDQKYSKNVSLSEIYEDSINNSAGVKKKKINKKRVGFKEDSEDK